MKDGIFLLTRGELPGKDLHVAYFYVVVAYLQGEYVFDALDSTLMDAFPSVRRVRHDWD